MSCPLVWIPFLHNHIHMAPNKLETKVEVLQKPSAVLSMEGLQRTTSDISFELTKEALAVAGNNVPLPPISEVEAAACECCGLSEDCTAEYIGRVKDKFMGKLICGLCAEAVNEEMEKVASLSLCLFLCYFFLSLT